MQKKLTITMDDVVYRQLHMVVGARKISRFIENLVKPYVINDEIRLGYAEMAKNFTAEQEAADLVEGLLQDDFN